MFLVIFVLNTVTLVLGKVTISPAGETGPFIAYDAKRSTILSGSMDKKTLITLNLKTNDTTSTPLYGQVFCVLPTDKERTAYVGLEENLSEISWHINGRISKKDNFLDLFYSSEFDVRVSALAVDRKGKLLIGTFFLKEDPANTDKHDKHAAIFTYDLGNRDEPPKKQIEGLEGVLHIAFNNAYNKIYFSDPYTKTVYEADYDEDTTTINYKHTFQYQVGGLDEKVGYISVDKDDNLWIAHLHTGRLVQLDTSTRKVLQTIDLGVKYPVGLAWGGPNLSTLYVGSLKQGIYQPEDDSPLAGKLLAVEGLGTSGMPLQVAKAS